MKKAIISIMAAAGLAACKPVEYTGPLDSPVGNWDGVYTEYFFDGDMVGEAEGCQYSAISFYKDGLCCIEGIKGAFPYTYDDAHDQLTIENTVWSVNTLTGAEMVLEYLETIFPDPVEPAEVQDDNPTAGDDEGESEGEGEGEGEEGEGEGEGEDIGPQPDSNGVILPAEYKGKTIYADSNGYYYEVRENDRIYCYFFGAKDETGTLVIDFWYDSHIDYFVPLVVEVTK